MPVVSILPYLRSIQLSPKAAANLRLIVAIETDGCNIERIMVGGIFIEVVDLQALPGRAAHTASPVRLEQQACRDVFWYLGSRCLGHLAL
jgi:hypothetical protein